MVADPWAREVRRQLGLGRLLPLGGAADGSWIAESAAAEVLRRAAAPLRGIRLGPLRLALADPATAVPPAVPPPPSALPVGPLRVTAEVAAAAGRPLPPLVDGVRAALWTASTEALGLVIEAVDLRVTELLDDAEGEDAPPLPVPDRAAAAAPFRTLRSVRTARVDGGSHTWVEIAVGPGQRALDSARAAREAVTAAGSGTVAAVVTAVDPP